MQITPKTKKEAEDLVFHIFLQGDMRHFDSLYFGLISDFILKKAISLEKETFSFNEVKENMNIHGPQKSEKLNALKILRLKNIGFEGFEMPFLSYKADILARKGGKVILIECGPCRLWKAISYLEEDANLWITRDENQTELFILTKGENWNSVYKEYKNRMEEKLKKIPSPFDKLIKDKDKNETKKVFNV